MNKRIAYLDYLKAIAIFLVIIFHSTAYDDVVLPPLLSMCVTIFFAVNGYLMLVKKRPYKYLLQKNLKIFFLVIFWGLLRSAFQSLVVGGNMDFLPIFEKFAAFKVGYGNYLWFLVALFILNLVNPLIYTFVHHSTRKDKMILCVLLLIFTANFIDLLSWKFNPLKHWYHSEALFYYVTGFFALTYAGRLKWPWWKIGMVFLAFYLLQLLQNCLFATPMFARLRVDLLVFGNYASIWVMGETLAFIVLMSKMGLKENKVVGFIGRNTLGIYLLQDFFCSITRNLMPGEYLAAYPLLVLLLCMAVMWLAERSKVLKWFVKI